LYNDAVSSSVSIVSIDVQFKPFEAEARLNNIYEFRPYRKENTALHRYTDQLVNAV
jgi:hypothetical protein